MQFVVPKLAKRERICQRFGSRCPDGDCMPTSSARTLKAPRRLQRHHDRRSASPRWQFLRGFIKNPVMVGSVIPSSRVLIEKMLRPVDWANTKVFVEYGPGVGTFTRRSTPIRTSPATSRSRSTIRGWWR
jgi:hypothetical protein